MKIYKWSIFFNFLLTINFSVKSNNEDKTLPSTAGSISQRPYFPLSLPTETPAPSLNKYGQEHNPFLTSFTPSLNVPTIPNPTIYYSYPDAPLPSDESEEGAEDLSNDNNPSLLLTDTSSLSNDTPPPPATDEEFALEDLNFEDYNPDDDNGDDNKELSNLEKLNLRNLRLWNDIYDELNQIRANELEVLSQPYAQTPTTIIKGYSSNSPLDEGRAQRAKRKRELRRINFQVKPRREDFKNEQEYQKALKIYKKFRAHEIERKLKYRKQQ